MNPNKRLLEFSGQLNQKLNYYGYATKDLDVPTTPESIDLFWDTFNPDIISGKFIIDDSKLAKSTFYKAVETHQNKIKEKKELILLINGYNAKVLKNSTKYILLENDKTALEGDAPLPSEPIEPQPQPQAVEQPNETEQNSNAESITEPQEQSVQQPPKPETPSKVEEASTADLAKSLTPEARAELVNDMLEQYERKLYNEKNTYSYKEPVGDFTTKNIYDDKFYSKTLADLKNKHRLVITGQTGAGKTELAYLLAHELTGEIVSNKNRNLKRTHITSAGQCLMGDSGKEIGALSKFINHIKENNITEPCVLICNEIHRMDLEFLIGSDLFEYFSDDEIPDYMNNVYLILTHTKAAASIPIDEQIEQRFPIADVKYISQNNSVIDLSKLRTAFGDVNYADKILSLAYELNTIEEDNYNSHGISTRLLIRKLKSGNNELILEKYESILQNKSKALLAKMRAL